MQRLVCILGVSFISIIFCVSPETTLDRVKLNSTEEENQEFSERIEDYEIDDLYQYELVQQYPKPGPKTSSLWLYNAPKAAAAGNIKNTKRYNI